MTATNCLVCASPTTQLCSGCKSVSYCSEAHQKKDWKAHKEYCTKIKEADNTFDAILFAENETYPRLIKVPWMLQPGDEYDGPMHKLDHSIWFKRPHSAVRPQYVPRWGLLGEELEHPLCFLFDDNFEVNKSPMNLCVQAVTGGRAGHRWCGNMLALRMGDSYDLFESADMEEDMKPLVKYFEEYGKVIPGEYSG